MVATAALRTGIDVLGITHVIHLEAPHSRRLGVLEGVGSVL
jgi:superfamily II DNA/RNA helicase